MSAFYEDTLIPYDTSQFLLFADLFIEVPTGAPTISLYSSPGGATDWQFFCTDFCADKGLILRRRYSENPDAWEYIRATISPDGSEVSLSEKICIQTDADYVNMGTERFASLRPA